MSFAGCASESASRSQGPVSIEIRGARVHNLKNVASESASRSQGPVSIEIRGARVHNLKNVNVDIPLGRMTGVAGVSGSGKSSLALGVL